MRTAKAIVIELPGLDAMEQHAGEAEGLLRTLANRHRLMVLCVLVNGEHTVSELNARVSLSQSALSQHLAVLRSEGLVSTRRDAQTIYYSVAEGPALQILKVLHDCYCSVPEKPARRRRVKEKLS